MSVGLATQMVNSASGSRRAIPCVDGMTVAEATDALRAAGLRPVALTHRFGGANLDALVRGTVPAEGIAVHAGHRVDLLPQQRRVLDATSPEAAAFDQGVWPDFTGWPIEDVFPFLPSGVGAETRRGYSDEVDYDHVITTDPRPGTAFASDFIRFWVSDGASPPVDPPDPLPDFIPTHIPDDFLEHVERR